MSEIIDSRDLDKELDELEAREDDQDDPLDADEAERMAELREARDNISEWIYGETLIREDYFTQYAQQLAEDIGAIDPSASWPLSHIDWEAAADALKQDYTEIELGGSTYYTRA